MGHSKSIHPVKNRASAISTRSPVEAFGEPGLTWSNSWKNRPVKQELENNRLKLNVFSVFITVRAECVDTQTLSEKLQTNSKVHITIKFT